MSSPQEAESSNSTLRPEYLIRAKSGTITEKISDAFTATFRRRQSSPVSSSATSDPSHALSKTISKITLKDIQDAKQCGGGGFGTVLIYEHPTKGKVALKQLRVAGAQRKSDLQRRTLREGEAWQDLNHPHVLPFLGILETPTELYLVSPFVKNGALDAYLREKPDADRQQFLFEAGGAIAYLHKRGIVHGDIKASNILVSDDMHALICDFGLAKFDDGVTSVGLQGVGTVRFQSPEVLVQGGGKTFATDVWAFGMTISEVLSGNAPFHQYTAGMAVITAVVLRDERPPKLPGHSPLRRPYDRAWDVAEACWQKDPAKRLSMQLAHRRLRPKGLALKGHTEPVSGVAFSPDGITIASGSYDGTLRLWDVASGSQWGEALKGHTGLVLCLAFSPDGTIIASGSYDCTLRLWDVASGTQWGKALEGHTGWVLCLAFSPDGTTIVSGSDDHTLRLWDVASGNQRGKVLKGHTSWVLCVAFSPDGTTIVSGSYDRTLRLWDVASGSQRGEALKGHTGDVNCLAFSPDGTTVVSGSRDGTLRLWDVASESQRGEALKGHTSGVLCLAFSPDGTTVVSKFKDCTLRLWDVSSGSQRGEALKGHTDEVACLAFSPDGTTVVSGSRDGTLRLWDVDL